MEMQKVNIDGANIAYRGGGRAHPWYSSMGTHWTTRSGMPRPHSWSTISISSFQTCGDLDDRM